jgi:hypothetical protein
MNQPITFSVSADSREITGQLVGSMGEYGHRIGSNLDENPIIMGGSLIYDEETGKCVGMEEPHYKIVELWQEGGCVYGRGVIVE